MCKKQNHNTSLDNREYILQSNITVTSIRKPVHFVLTDLFGKMNNLDLRPPTCNLIHHYKMTDFDLLWNIHQSLSKGAGVICK